MRYVICVTGYIIEVSQAERGAFRERSAAIFGNRYMADVVAVVADLAAHSPDGVTVRMVNKQTQIPDGLIKQVMKRLVGARLLRELPRNGPRAPLHHTIEDTDGVWTVLVDICRNL
ncbi:hypothetical protein NRB56_28260 [Nocardia sp. RB56]|uniref:Transcriptional regulator n=2 Tax=Nocardia aurantia TaxID=2585199 RepID=A0A7K0DNC7_9NOCA|nr:hypothetical protein [Nocardia aurantia]